MVFKLVRTDCEGPNKIQLPVGTHLIGRGKFLDCEDKRISRNHGNLIVDDDSVAIEALHQNPCFWTKKGSTEVKILKKASKEILQNGDRFGLLPASFWYELLHIPDSDSQATDVSDTQEYSNGNNNEAKANDKHENKSNDETIQDGNVNPPTDENKTNDETIKDSNINPPTDEGKHDDSELLDFDLNETVEDAARPESPSLLDQEDESQPAVNNSINVPGPEPSGAMTHDTDKADEPASSVKTEPKSPSPKRSHSPDSQEGAKKIKVEPDVKPDPDSVAGPSNDQAGAPKPVGDGSKVPSPPAAPRRERCLYGASCYRKNPHHKAEFSHPSDADWGAAPRTPCPRGAACRKRDARHYDLHDHPPGHAARPPPLPAGAQVVERRGNIFYINAHSVNFYDDHFNVEGSDGDSVDFDYEF